VCLTADRLIAAAPPVLARSFPADDDSDAYLRQLVGT
jgi:hypothetical protein